MIPGVLGSILSHHEIVGEIDFLWRALLSVAFVSIALCGKKQAFLLEMSKGKISLNATAPLLPHINIVKYRRKKRRSRAELKNDAYPTSQFRRQLLSDRRARRRRTCMFSLGQFHPPHSLYRHIKTLLSGVATFSHQIYFQVLRVITNKKETEENVSCCLISR